MNKHPFLDLLLEFSNADSLFKIATSRNFRRLNSKNENLLRYKIVVINNFLKRARENSFSRLIFRCFPLYFLPLMYHENIKISKNKNCIKIEIKTKYKKQEECA